MVQSSEYYTVSTPNYLCLTRVFEIGYETDDVHYQRPYLGSRSVSKLMFEKLKFLYQNFYKGVYV